MAQGSKDSEACLPVNSPKLHRKAGAQKFREQQIFTSEEATDLTVSRCTGVLRGEGVVVTARPHIAALVRLGSYGKGVFSRSIPCHNVAPSFSLPWNRERHKSGSVRSEVPPGLTREDHDLVKKMADFEQCQERRVALHTEWRREEAQLAAGPDQGHSPPAQSFADCSPSPVASGNRENITEGNIEKDDATKSTLSFEEQLKHFKNKLEVLEKSDPYKMDEYLQLSSEEALYLSHDLRLLNITTDDTTELLSTQELWSHFCNNQFFPPKYAAYRYYRRKGWVLKSGIKFGVEFVLYKKGPVEYHSSYAVVVRLLTESEVQSPSQDRCSRLGRTLTWRDVVAMDRVSKSVVKELILCHVIVKEGVDQQLLWRQFPDCLENVRIAEVLVNRWDPDRGR